MFRKVYDFIRLLISELTAKRVFDSAAALTYSTILAIVPIMAVVFAVARGFGYSKYIETWFRDMLTSQPQAAEIIIGFVNSYLVHTKSGIILGLGLVFMLWTVLMLVSNIEKTFNDIWQVKKPRSLFRTFTDYIAMLFLVPIIIVVMAGISIFMATIADNLDQYVVISSVAHFLIDLSPYILLSGAFFALYVFMPNTKVHLRSAILPAILAGTAMQWLQFFYIHSQIWVSSYNAIYGSFAALPLFMLWVQFSWIICLVGAELTYTMQNLEESAFMSDAKSMSHRYRMMLSALLLSLICKRFAEGRKPYTALELKLETNIPIRVTSELLYDMTQAHLILETYTTDEKGDDPVYLPAESLDNLSVGTMIDRLESQGGWKLDIHLRDYMSVNWGKAFDARHSYLKSQREILMKDL
jgi:membrane protein